MAKGRISLKDHLVSKEKTNPGFTKRVEKIKAKKREKPENSGKKPLKKAVKNGQNVKKGAKTAKKRKEPSKRAIKRQVSSISFKKTKKKWIYTHETPENWDGTLKFVQKVYKVGEFHLGQHKVLLNVYVEESCRLTKEGKKKRGYSGKTKFIDMDELPDNLHKPFTKWITGQTRPLILSFLAVYDYDFERWYEAKYNGVPTYWD